MNIFICGQKSFGTAVLERLIEDGHTVTGVAPPPYEDKITEMAKALGVPVVSDCRSLKPWQIPKGTELIITAHSHWIITEPCLNACKYGGIGFHPSLLPRHRGVDAVRWTVHMCDTITGGTVYQLGDKCDGGDIILQRWLFVDKAWDYHDLWKRLFPMGVDMLSEAVSQIENGTAEYTKQDEAYATYEPSWHRPRLERNNEKSN